MNKQLEVRIAPSRNLRIIGSSQSHTTLSELYSLIREGHDMRFTRKGEDISAKYHICVLKEREIVNPEPEDTALLNRIVRAGGLINYMRRLENE
jgi:hypothetical protein